MVTLNQEDQAVLDQLANHGYDLQAVEPAQRQRAKALLRVLGLLDQLPKEQAGDLLIARTMQAVTQQRQQQIMDRQIQTITGTSGFRWPEMVTLAACLLIGVSVIFPIFGHQQAVRNQTTCQANMGLIGAGFGRYADANNNRMPQVDQQHVLGQTHWWRTDGKKSEYSNSANLFQLIAKGYVKPTDFHCPANEFPPQSVDPKAHNWPKPHQTSYSYQLQYDNQPDPWNGKSAMPILADRNPYFTENQYLNLPQNQDSPLHHYLAGQNMLYNDGHVQWADQPKTESGDSIYHLKGETDYDGLEIHHDPNDVFLIW